MTLKFLLVAGIHFVASIYLSRFLCYLLPNFIKCFYVSSVDNIAFLGFSILLFEFTRKRFLNDRAEPSVTSVFITGCDTGFGHMLAKRLDAKGYHVNAGCLFPSGDGASALKRWCSQRLRIVELDVTKDESVNRAVECVKDNTRTSGTKLWAIVNNAGIHKGLTVEFSSMGDFKDSMEVNTFGSIRVTKAFLPLLKETKGRVVNVVSLLGRVCVQHIAPYSVSKHAQMAYNHCLRQEMSLWGISVVSVEPELFETSMSRKENVEHQVKATIAALPESVASDYGQHYLDKYPSRLVAFLSNTSPKTKLVVNDLESAVTLKYPQNHYRTSRNLLYRFILFLFVTLPSSVQDIYIKIGLYTLNFPKPKALIN